jgi:hypothetical protein
VPCPDTEPTEVIDEYGRKITNRSFHIALTCLDSKSTMMQKRFDSLKDAEKFVEDGRNSFEIMNQLSDFKISKITNE